MKPAPHFLNPLLKNDGQAYVLRHVRTGAVVADQLELAGASPSRRRGLLGRTSLGADAAMIIAPCNAIHTWFMKFTIDVVFVDRQGRVLKVYPQLAPWRIGVSVKAFAAVELAAGGIDRSGITIGDSLKVAPGQG